ncbi:MAG: hypothetical protein HC804_06315 [Anaerolineae bacterium]|nr:hypothetical protein [Anaerolineae bacterium]
MKWVFKRNSLVAGVCLMAMWLLMGCVPTSEPVTVAETRLPVTAVAPTTAQSPALLAQWNESSDTYDIRLVDATTGVQLPGYDALPLAGNELYMLQTAWAADGRTLAAVAAADGPACESESGGTACRARAAALHLVDTKSWQSVIADLPDDGWVSTLLFNATGTQLAVAHHTENESQLLLFDAVTGGQLAQQPIPFRPTLIAFADDGSLVLAGADEGENRGVTKPGPFTVQVRDGITLAEQWSQTLPEIVHGNWCTANCEGEHTQRQTQSWQPGVVAAPDGRFLYIVHADDDMLTTVDLHGRTVQTRHIQAAQSWLERLLARTAQTAVAKSLGDGAYKTAVLAPDGSRLYAVGFSWHIESVDGAEPEHQTEYLGLQVVDPVDGRLLASKETSAERLRLTPDGAYLLLDGWETDGRADGLWFEVWDAVSLELITRLEDRQVTAVPLLDGGYVLLASTADGQQLYLSLMSPPRFKCAPIWTADSSAFWIAGQ